MHDVVYPELDYIKTQFLEKKGCVYEDLVHVDIGWSRPYIELVKIIQQFHDLYS